MPVFEITSPDGRVLEIEGDKAPSESELDNIFKSIPVESNKGSINQSALSNVKSTDDEPEIGMSIAERFNKLRQDSVQYAANIPQKEAGMSWVEYAKLRKKYDEDWGLNTPDLNPLKSIWKMSILGSINEKLYRGQKEKRAGKYIDNTEVLTEVPAQALADWEKKGQIKAGEAFIRSDWSRTIPFLGSGTAIDEATDIKKIIDKKNKGEELSKKEITQLNAYILDVAEQNYRGVSFGGKLIQGALELPSFAGEFMATGGLASIGKNAIQKTITRGLQEATKKEVGKRLTKGLLEGAAGAVTRTSLGMPQRVAENYGMRKLHESLGITDKGQVVLETADTSPALTFLKAWGDTVIENWSEEMGAGLGEAAGLSFKSLNKLASPLEKKLFSRDTRAAFIKAMRTLRPNATVKDIMARAGFNGILEEMGEERAGSVLRVIFGIDDRQDVSTFEKLCEAINPGAEELLLELGLFSIPGSMSFAASQVARHLRNQNVDEQTISDYMKLTSELEKEKFLGDIADNKDLTNAINFENDVRDLKNRYFTQNLNAGLEKEEALAAADIQSNAVSSLAKNIGMDINELNREFAINTQSLTAEQAKAQQQADSLVLRGGVEMNVVNDTEPQFQSAMYKSPKKDFEEFYNQVFEKESEIKESKSKQKKSYFDYTNENISVRIPHDTVIHDENRHRLSAEEWHNVLSNLDTPADVAYSNKPRFDGQPLLLKIIGNNNETYGVVVETFEKKQPIITTVFIDSEENIDKWLNKNRAAQAKNTSSVTTKGMLLSQNPNSIITEVRKKLKPVRTQGSFDNSNSNIYYQAENNNIVDLTDDFEKSPTIQEVKNYINKIIEEGIKFATANPDFVVDIKGGNRVKKKILNASNYKKLDKMSRKRHNKYIMSLEKLLANAEYSGAKENTKKDKKPNIEKYHYFTTNVKVGSKVYKIVFDTEEYKNENQLRSDYAKRSFKETEADTNSITDNAADINQKNENPQGANTKTVLPKEHLEDTNSITDNAAGFNPKTVHLYNITEIKKPETYYHSGDDYNPIDDARGFTYQRFNFDGTTKDNLIVLLKNKSDKSTLLHEFAHVYLTTLNNLALRNVRAKELLNTVNKWLNYNGVEYTTKQHEKFANGFVAYVKSGKAPTYGLKRAFENFKRWLNDLYTNLSMSEEIELDDKAKTVFDELLGDNTIEAKDKKVAELIDKAKQNALLRLNYEYAEKRKITPLHLTERQRRFRDTAYDILFTAAIHTKDSDGNPLVKNKQELYMLFGNNSNYQKKNKGIKLRKEKIEQYLLEVDDPFSGGDGFQRNWAEFFYDPGVSYENMTAGADSELVKQALDVINEKRYLYDSNNLNNKNEFSEEDIKKAQYELEYLIDDYKNTKNKDITMAAFFDWADSVHPYIQEDIITQWENRTNEIDRYDNLTEFQKAKEDLKIYAATLEGYGDYSSQFAEYARKIIKRLDFMTEHDKMKIFDKLKDYSSFREIERNLDSVMDYAETLNDVSLRKNLADTIINEIKRTTPEIVKGTKKTRYDYQTNKLFERLREINRMKQEQVKDLYDAYVNGELERRAAQFEENGTITGKTEDYFEDIENSFIQFKANGIYYNSTESLQTLLDKIQNAKFTGKVARDEIDFQQRMNQQNWINNCAQAVEAHKNKVGQLEELYSMEANFDSLLSMIFDDKIKNKFSLDLLYAQVDGKVGKDREEVLNKIADIFGYKGILKGTMLNNKFIEMANDKYKIKQRYANKYETDNLGVWDWETITLSKMEILYYYIQAKNPTSYEMLTDMGDETRAPKGQFDRGEFEELLSNLTPQEKLMGDVLQMAAEKYYPELNKYHIKKHHIDMGKVTCYFPRKSELKEVNELDLFNQYTEKSTNPKFVKMRSAGPSIRITPANPVNVLFNHIQKANTIIIMGEQLDLMNKVFRDNDLRVKIQSVFGDKVYTEFMQHVTANLYDGQVTTLSNAEGIISRLMSNIIAAPMFIKPQIGIKQVLGLINYGLGNEYVGSIEWLKAFIKTMKHPREAIDFMMNDEYLKDRLTRANLNEAMKNHIDNKLFSRVSLLNDYFSLNMRFGDLLNLCWGGKAYIDVLMKKGFTKEQAFELFRQKTISDQQSSINSTLSNLQRNSKNNPFARLLFAYQNTPHQYFRICANAVIQAKQGKISKRQAVKTIFLYWYVLPLIFNMAGSLSPITLLTTGDPDELYTDMRISCLGSITCLPFIGEWVRAAWAGVTGEEYFGERDWFTRVAQITASSINKFKKDELSFEDILKSLEIFAQGAGIPLEAIDTQIEAVGDYAQGDIAKGFLKTLGFSRYRAKKVTGED